MSVLRTTEAMERDQVGRGVGIILLLGIALIHLLDAVDKASEQTYIFVLYLLLMAGCLAVAAFLLRTDSRSAWTLLTLIAGLTLIAFVLSRTTGLPGFDDEVGAWNEPLGMASLFTEGVALLLGLYKLATTPRIEPGGLPAAIAGSDEPVEGLARR
jgi:di/tricarboxylate transporter